MINKDSAEYKTVMGLFDDGKITAEERDRLLDALGFTDDEVAVKPEEHADVSDGASASESGADGVHTKDDDGNTLQKVANKLSELGDSISEKVNKGLKIASEALERSGRKIKNAIATGAPETLFDLGDGAGNYKHIKTKAIKYDEPYESLTIKVVYAEGANYAVITEKTTDSDKLIKECAKQTSMTDEDMEALRKLLSEKFTGVYTRIIGDKIIKITVAP